MSLSRAQWAGRSQPGNRRLLEAPPVSIAEGKPHRSAAIGLRSDAGFRLDLRRGYLRMEPAEWGETTTTKIEVRYILRTLTRDET